MLLGVVCWGAWCDRAWSDESVTHRARRDALVASLAKTSQGGVVVLGNRPTDHDLWPSPDFYYLTGIHRHDAILALTWRDGVVRQFLFVRGQSDDDELFHGARVLPGDGAAAALRYERVRDLDDAEAALDALVVATRGDMRIWLGAQPWPECTPPVSTAALVARAAARGVDVRDPARVIAEQRMVKDAGELARIERAVELTSVGIHEALRSVRPDQRERELAAVVEFVARRNGGDARMAFNSIVGGGPNACVLHHEAAERMLRGGELVLIDVGAQYDGYAADLTRTIPVNGRFTDEQRALYRTVLAAQRAAIARVRPGATLDDVERAARAVLTVAGYSDQPPHLLTHHVGIDVHDPGDRDVPLRPGMVIAVEPGIYVRERAVGIRIEDNVLVTKDGSRVLSSWLAREPEDVERVIAEGGGLGRVRAPLERERLGARD